MWHIKMPIKLGQLSWPKLLEPTFTTLHGVERELFGMQVLVVLLMHPFMTCIPECWGVRRHLMKLMKSNTKSE